MTTPERVLLAAAQQRLLAALLSDAPAPPGFDPARLRVQSAALAAKRASRTAPVPEPPPRRSLLRRRHR